MFEDEEIVCEGNGLYQHLVDLGYSDFETFVNSPSSVKESTNEFVENYAKYQDVNLRSNGKLLFAEEDHKLLASILNSQLVFKEDSFIVESAVSDTYISKRKSHFWNAWPCASVLLGLISSTFALKRKTGFYISCCLVLIYSGNIAWNLLKKYMHLKKSKTLDAYLKISRKLCWDIHKHLRFLNEIQILSTAKLTTDKYRVNIPSVLYNQATSLNPPGDENMNLPHLTKCLSDSLVEIIAILMLNKDLLRNSQKFSLLFDNYCVSDLENPDELISQIIKGDKQIPIKVLKQLSELYLVLQSEYLRDIGLVLSPVTESLSALRSSAQEEAFRQLSTCQNKLANIHFKLTMQYQLHNIIANGKPPDNVISNIQPSSKLEVSRDDHRLELKHLRMDIHNIFLLLYSALLRVKNFEDHLENLSEVNVGEKEQANRKLVSELSVQMSDLRNDLSSTASCFDVMYQQMLGQNKSRVDPPTELDSSHTSPHSSETAKEPIFLGKTDFSINSIDEVFLGISELNSGERFDDGDDWCLERKPRIPTNLLAELSSTLKSRKEDFIERERLAVERQGLQELEREIVSDSSSDEDSMTRTHPRRAKKSKRLKVNSQSSSDSEEDKSQQNHDPQRNSKMPHYKKINPTNHSDNGSSSEEDIIDESSLAKNLFTDNSSLANLIAAKSQMWGNTSEDFYSDG